MAKDSNIAEFVTGSSGLKRQITKRDRSRAKRSRTSANSTVNACLSTLLLHDLKSSLPNMRCRILQSAFRIRVTRSSIGAILASYGKNKTCRFLRFISITARVYCKNLGKLIRPRSAYLSICSTTSACIDPSPIQVALTSTFLRTKWLIVSTQSRGAFIGSILPA